MSTQARLERLESELAAVKRRSRRLGGLLAALVVAGLTLAWTEVEGGSDTAQEVVRAQRFLLEDADGTVRGAWGAGEDGGGVGLYDATGELRVSLAETATGPQLHLVGDGGEMRVQIAISEEGSSLRLYDDTGQVRTILGAGGSQTPDGAETTHPESSINLAGPNGKVLWSAP